MPKKILFGLSVLCIVFAMISIIIFVNSNSQISKLNADNTELTSDNIFLQNQINDLQKGYHTVDPTTEQVAIFINSQLIPPATTTIAEDLALFVNNAEAKGYRCGVVLVTYMDYYTDTFAVFNTIDNGFKFIDASYLENISLTIGQKFCVLNNYIEPDYDDTILSYTIAW